MTTICSGSTPRVPRSRPRRPTSRTAPRIQSSRSRRAPRIRASWSSRRASAAARFLHLNTNRGRLSIATAGTTHGHATVTSTGSYGVAATPAGAAFPQAFSAGRSRRDVQLRRTATHLLSGRRHPDYRRQRVLDRRTGAAEARHHRGRRCVGHRRRRVPKPVLRHVGCRATRRRDRGAREGGQPVADRGADSDDPHEHGDRHPGGRRRSRLGRRHHHGARRASARPARRARRSCRSTACRCPTTPATATASRKSAKAHG